MNFVFLLLNCVKIIRNSIETIFTLCNYNASFVFLTRKFSCIEFGGMTLIHKNDHEYIFDFKYAGLTSEDGNTEYIDLTEKVNKMIIYNSADPIHTLELYIRQKYLFKFPRDSVLNTVDSEYNTKSYKLN